LRRDFTTGEEGLTLAAALIFGTDEVIGNLLPAYRIDILERRENNGYGYAVVLMPYSHC